MREIKFRAKHISTGEWVYGSPRIFHHPKDEHEVCLMLSEDKTRVPVIHTVNAETVGEFTGIKDRYDKEVYEDDFIEWGGFYVGDHWQKAGRGPVVFEEAEFSISGCPAGLWEVIQNHYGYVGGNIYDNPELMEAK